MCSLEGGAGPGDVLGFPGMLLLVGCLPRPSKHPPRPPRPSKPGTTRHRAHVRSITRQSWCALGSPLIARANPLARFFWNALCLSRRRPRPRSPSALRDATPHPRQAHSLRPTPAPTRPACRARRFYSRRRGTCHLAPPPPALPSAAFVFPPPRQASNHEVRQAPRAPDAPGVGRLLHRLRRPQGPHQGGRHAGGAVGRRRRVLAAHDEPVDRARGQGHRRGRGALLPAPRGRGREDRQVHAAPGRRAARQAARAQPEGRRGRRAEEGRGGRRGRGPRAAGRPRGDGRRADGRGQDGRRGVPGAREVRQPQLHGHPQDP